MNAIKRAICIAIILSLVLLFMPYASSQETPTQQEAVGQITGVSPEYIPQSPEDFDKQKEEYLNKEWDKLITENPVYGPINQFFNSHQNFFLAVFAHEYEFSGVFFLIFVFWVMAVIQIYKMISSIKFVSSAWVEFIMALVLTILLAHTGLFEFIATFITALFAGKNYWMRLILGLLVLLAIFLENYVSRYLTVQIKKYRLSKENADLKNSQSIIKTTADKISKKN